MLINSPVSLTVDGADRMQTIIKRIEEHNFRINELKEAAEILKEGGLVALPTETVYGLGADALNPEAAGKIYQAKGRPSDNPLIIHISKIDSLKELVSEVPEMCKKLADKYWPGPLTVVLNKSKKVPYETTGGLDTVAIRMPENDIARGLIDLAGVYIAAPSANTSGKPSPTRASHVIEDLDGKIDMIIDGGSVGIGLESTIVDFTSEVPTILRPGAITKPMIEEVIGKVVTDQAILTENADAGLAPKAPGMKYKHYAPSGELAVVEGNAENVVDEINKRASLKMAEGKRVGIIATTESKDYYQYGIIKEIGSRNDEDSIARGLYGILRDFDQLGAEYIYSESFTGDELGQAIMNRLLKAAGHHIIYADDVQKK